MLEGRWEISFVWNNAAGLVAGLIIPFYTIKNELLYFQAEAFNKEQGAKSGTPGSDDHLSSAILMVTLDSAKDLPVSFPLLFTCWFVARFQKLWTRGCSGGENPIICNFFYFGDCSLCRKHGCDALYTGSCFQWVRLLRLQLELVIFSQKLTLLIDIKV